MKIEIGESLVYTWMRHVRGCKLAQLNWKPSPRWDVDESTRHVLEAFMQEADATFAARGLDVFKKTTGLNQQIKQTECDAFGVCEDAGAPVAIVAESAFHENGLNYGDKMETCAKVIAKMTRAAMAIHAYLPWVRQFEAIFSSPRINPNIMEILPGFIEELNALLVKHGIAGCVRLFANDSFKAELLKPVLEVRSAGVADTSELFLRSIQLLDLFAGENLAAEEKCGNLLDLSSSQVDKGKKIGKLVQTSMRAVLESGRCPESEVVLLTRNDYSKQQFGIQFPVLSEDREIMHGVPRYYSKPLTIRGKKYYLCSQWYERNLRQLENWLATHQK